jgi:hypothetical protein
MPIYASNKTYRGGFYNNKIVNGNNDRVYTAEDIRKPYDVIYTDGIKPDTDGTAGDNLKVSAGEGMVINIAKGYAKLGGAWFVNESNYSITLDNATSTTRYDCVIIRNDDNENVREPLIYIKSLDHIPTKDDLTRDGMIYEVCIAYVIVESTTYTLTDSNIIDTRVDGSLCNVMSGVGATVVRTYRNTYYSSSENQTSVPIGIKQYNKAYDTLIVLVEGRVFTEGINYSITNNDYIRLYVGLPIVGTKIEFEVHKNVNAASADSVVGEVSLLNTQMNAVNHNLEHHYYCNGLTDNVNISNIISEFQTGASDYSSVRLIVHGVFGATSPLSGSGTSASPYIWMKLAQGTVSNRKVIVDFTDCRQITIECEADSYNVIMYGMDVNVVGINIIATNGAYIYMFSTPTNIKPYAENCRFWITATSGGLIAKSGTFRNCRVSLTIPSGNAYVFDVYDDGLLRVYGGEYYAYAGSSYTSSIVRIASGQTIAVAITYGLNCPTYARSGYVQSYAIYDLSASAKCSYTDTITALTISASGQNIRGTIAVSKAGMM